MDFLCVFFIKQASSLFSVTRTSLIIKNISSTLQCSKTFIHRQK